jgi:hypothetical protein
MQITREKWEAFFLSWAAFGVYFFTATFFWASGTAPLRTVFYLFLLIPFLMVLPWRKWRMQEYGGKYTLVALAFTGYLALSSLWGKPSDFSTFLKQWLLLAFWLCGVSWVFYHRNFDVQKLYRVLVSVGAITAIFSVTAFYWHKGNNLNMRLEGMGLAENPTIVAQIFGVVALLGYVLSLQSSSWRISQLWFLVAIVCSLPMFFSQSRGAGLSLLIASIISLVIIRPPRSIWIPQIAAGLFVGLLLLFTLDIDLLMKSRASSLSERDVIWIELICRSLENMVFGIGLENDARIIIPDVDVFHHAHNSWIDILYYSGWCGLALGLWHLLILLRGFTKKTEILPIYLWFIFGCMCQFTNGSALISAPDAEWWMYWVPAGLLAALVSSRRYDS